MRLLLDTHILIWSLVSPHKVQDPIKRLMEDGENSLFVSSITFYEIEVKRQIGKLSFKMDFNELLERKFFSVMDFNHHHALYTGELPLIHRDPFDRILIAQSVVENMPLVTADEVIHQYNFHFIKA
tara:strand:+ start:56305 stop:56682 length:378 start_codon:yes stop_codon:yes gene_type:complete